MTCKIDRVVYPDASVVLHISGRIDAADVEMLGELIERELTAQSALAMDLTEVTLVSRDAIKVLAAQETRGIELRNCPAYIRHWVSREKRRGVAETE
jgi:anti-anti-sigma regulatory factor